MLLKKIILLLVIFPQVLLCQNSIDSLLHNTIDFSAPIIKIDEIQTAKNYVFLDAREIEEYNVSHIQNAVFVGFNLFSVKKIEKQLLDKNQAIIVYCSIGYRSEKVTNQLIEAGYINAKNLYGGIFEWKNQKCEVVDNNEMATEKVHVFSEEWSKWLYHGIKVY